MSVPAGVPEKTRFRPRIGVIAGGHTSRCTLRPSLSQIFYEIDSAISGAISFARPLLQQERRLFDTEGMSAAHARAKRAMCTCFDLGRLVHAPPTVADVTSFA